MSKLTVLILAAGFGRRMGGFSRIINKALIPYGNKPLVSHIFDKFNNDTRFIIACGHLGNQIKDYIAVTYPNKDITFIDVPDYAEASTGPATTIRYCAKQFTGPFMWISSDTLFKFNYSDKLTHNWIAVHPVDSKDAADYSWVEREGEELIRFHNKQPSLTAVDAFIGLMYVHDRKFIETLDLLSSKEVYEGFSLSDHNTSVHTVSDWQDFGTYEKWKRHNDIFEDVSFPKPDELFYDDNNVIVKFSTNIALTEAKYNRSNMNINAMPTKVRMQGNFLAYDKKEGVTLYKALTPPRMYDFLSWVTSTLWKKDIAIQNQWDVAHRFYYDKTIDRLALFRIKYPTWTEPNRVNNTNVRTIDEYLASINFVEICNQSKFAFIHGDMQPENIIYNYIDKKFTAIDWRPDFGGFPVGDIYYDIAKLVGGLYLNYERVKSNNITYSEGDTGDAHIEMLTVGDVSTHVNIIRHWVEKQNLSWTTVQTLVPIIYLNMAPLHEAPFDKYLIALSQYFFSRI
jgi:NDP-sugar pyrophosphorylase family protein